MQPAPAWQRRAFAALAQTRVPRQARVRWVLMPRAASARRAAGWPAQRPTLALSEQPRGSPCCARPSGAYGWTQMPPAPAPMQAGLRPSGGLRPRWPSRLVSTNRPGRQSRVADPWVQTRSVYKSSTQMADPCHHPTKDLRLNIRYCPSFEPLSLHSIPTNTDQYRPIRANPPPRRPTEQNDANSSARGPNQPNSARSSSSIQAECALKGRAQSRHVSAVNSRECALIFSISLVS
jgi:hypothetical protein